VETAASDLAALIDAQRAEKERFEGEMKAAKELFETEMQESRAQWKRERAEHDRLLSEQADSLKKQRQREKEEYEYAFAREKEQRKNKLEDELDELKKEIGREREALEQTSAQRTSDLNAREEAVTKREKAMEALQKEVDTFPKRLENAVQSAVDQTTDRLNKDFEKDKALMESRFEGEKNVLNSKIESLEKLAAAYLSQISDLSRKHEQAYEKVQDIANRAVASAKKEVYLTPLRAQSPSGSRDDDQRER